MMIHTILQSTQGPVSRFRLLLELARFLAFIVFYLLSAHIIFVALTHVSLFLSLAIGGVALLFAMAVLWKSEWVMYGFVIAVPMVSGFQFIGYMKEMPLLSVGFAGIFLVWLPKRLFWDRKGLVSEDCQSNLVDILSALVMISLIMLLLPYPGDFVLTLLWELPFVGQNDSFYCIQGAYVILQGLFFFRVMVLEVGRVHLLQRVVWILYIQTGIIILFSLVQWIFNMPPKESGFIVYAPFDDKHSFGSYMVFLFFVLLELAQASSVICKLVSALIVPLLIVLIVLCWSRMTWLAAILVATALFVIRYPLKKSLYLIGTLCIIAICLNLYPDVIQTSENIYLKRLSKLVLLDEVKRDSAVDGRFYLWSRALRIMRDYPCVGSGVGSYFRVSLNWEHSEESNYANFTENAHNYYLQFGAELGIPALLIFLTIIVYTYRIGFAALKRICEYRAFLSGLLLGLSAYLVTMLTGHPLLLSNQQFLFWFVIGVVNIGWRKEQEDSTDRWVWDAG